MASVLIVGGGDGGTALLPILHEYKEIEVVGLVDVRTEAPGLLLAKQMGIATGNSFEGLFRQASPDIIINVTGCKEVSNALRRLKKRENVEVIEGSSAKVIFKLVDERRIREREALSRLKELEALYEIGIMLTSSESEDELLKTILINATQFTGSPAGSIALYDEENNSMELVQSLGFGEDLAGRTSWRIRHRGLTEYILNHGSPLVINDTDQFNLADNAEIHSMGIKSLIAIPLIVEHRTIGIIYVDDFVPRQYSKNQQSILALLATQAAIAIEKMQRFEKTRRLAITDGLTGLYNHRYFAKSLRRELKRANRNDRPLSVIIIDIDHFKQFNDTNGHLQGNEVLKGVARIMKQALRNVDILARYGGEEFAIILPETDKKQGLDIAQRICHLMAQETFEGAETQPLKRITLSAGIASFPQDARKENSLTNRADKALYIAKEQGRNRAIPFPD